MSGRIWLLFMLCLIIVLILIGVSLVVCVVLMLVSMCVMGMFVLFIWWNIVLLSVLRFMVMCDSFVLCNVCVFVVSSELLVVSVILIGLLLMVVSVVSCLISVLRWWCSSGLLFVMWIFLMLSDVKVCVIFFSCVNDRCLDDGMNV